MLHFEKIYVFAPGFSSQEYASRSLVREALNSMPLSDAQSTSSSCIENEKLRTRAAAADVRSVHDPKLARKNLVKIKGCNVFEMVCKFKIL
jgi:hypothetical protein